MKKLLFNILMMSILLTGVAVSVQAQATRTWISGVGDDVNPCSPTAPCKTLQGTISKTAANGEMNILDPGGFGAVTITKSMTIIAHDITGVLVTGTNGIIINDGGAASIVVNLKGLDMNGLTTGLNGIRILSAKSVTVEDSLIYGFNNGISDERTTGGNLFVSNTTIRNNATAGISMSTASTPPTTGAFDNVKLVSSAGTGLVVRAGNSAVIRNSLVSDNAVLGISVNDANTSLAIEGCVITFNPFGVSIKAGTPIVRISTTLVTKNDTGLRPGSGQIISFGNNRISGNNNENLPTSTVAEQ